MLSLADWEKRLGELQKDNAELREQSEQLQVLLKDVSTDLGAEVHSMSMSMSMHGLGGGLSVPDLETAEELERLRSEKASLEVGAYVPACSCHAYHLPPLSHHVSAVPRPAGLCAATMSLPLSGGRGLRADPRSPCTRW